MSKLFWQSVIHTFGARSGKLRPLSESRLLPCSGGSLPQFAVWQKACLLEGQCPPCRQFTGAPDVNGIHGERRVSRQPGIEWRRQESALVLRRRSPLASGSARTRHSPNPGGAECYPYQPEVTITAAAPRLRGLAFCILSAASTRHSRITAAGIDAMASAIPAHSRIRSST